VYAAHWQKDQTIPSVARGTIAYKSFQIEINEIHCIIFQVKLKTLLPKLTNRTKLNKKCQFVQIPSKITNIKKKASTDGIHVPTDQ
jgi:hypothetical protein